MSQNFMTSLFFIGLNRLNIIMVYVMKHIKKGDESNTYRNHFAAFADRHLRIQINP